MKRIFIVNQKAGTKTIYVTEQLEKICNDDKLDYEIYKVEDTEATKNICNKYKDDSNNIIYCVGGDGTLNSIVNNIVNSNSSLSIIPSGTGNDFYRNELTDSKIDVGLVNDKYFINVASVGMDANVAYLANKYKLEQVSGNVYIKAAIKTLFDYKEPKVLINDEKTNLCLVAVCNGGYYGNGIHVAPTADLCDGYFDICLLDNVKSKITKALLFSKLLKGNHMNNSKITYYQDDKIVITSNKELLCNVDGEIIKDNRFAFSIVKNAINIKKEDNDKILNLTKSLTK